MSMDAGTSDRLAPSPLLAIGAGAAVGLFTGVIEAVITVGGKLAFNAAKQFGLGFWWMAPVAETVLFTGFALIGFLALRLLRVRNWWPVLLGLLAFLAALSIGLLVHRLAKVAVLFAAAAIAVRAFVVARSRAVPSGRSVAGFTAGVAAVVALGALGLGLRGWRFGVVSNAAAGESRPNVLLIVLDTEGASSLGLYGNPRNTSPALDSLAASSAVFTRAYATAPWTLPSHGSLFTGRHAHELRAGFREPLDDRYPTLAEILGGRGYLTAGFVANLRYTNREFGLARGFDHYEDYPRSLAEVAMASSLFRRAALHGVVRRRLGFYDVIARKRADRVSDDFLRWVDGHAGHPWFAFLNYWDAHEPYLPGPAAAAEFGAANQRRDFRKADYRIREVILHQGFRKGFSPEVVEAEKNAHEASIAEVDRGLGRLFAELARRGLDQRTLIVITADHGEEHGERGAFTHAHSVNPASIWVPLVVRLPGVVPAARIDSVVSTRRVAATILDLLGSAAAPTMAGPSLASYWRDSTTRSEAALSQLINGEDTLYSVIMGGVQFQLENGVAKLVRIAPEAGPEIDLTADSGYREPLRRGRAILDSVLKTGSETRAP